MARIIHLLELQLNGETFRLEIGGVVALAEGDQPVAVVRLDSLDDAERLETLARPMPVTFRWKTGHNVSKAISVADLEKTRARAPTPQLVATVSGDRNTQPGKTDQCVNCGHEVPPEMYNRCVECEYTPEFDHRFAD
jgi:hypothetical protein